MPAHEWVLVAYVIDSISPLPALVEMTPCITRHHEGCNSTLRKAIRESGWGAPYKELNKARW